MESILHRSVTSLPMVGLSRKTLLNRLGIYTIGDLLFHIPFRYDDFSHTTPIGQVTMGETVTVIGELGKMGTFTTKTGKRIIQGQISDATGKLTIVWFNQQYLLKVLKEGMQISFSGEVTFFGTKRVLSNPQYEILSQNGNGETLHTGRLVAIYPETEGLSSKWLRGKIHPFMDTTNELFPEYLPENIRTTHGLMLLPDAVRAIHFPDTKEASANARRRLAFDELLAVQAKALQLKKAWEDEHTAKPILISEKKCNDLLSCLPFTLTLEQQTVVADIRSDLQRTVAMNRLLIGDVGSGKTVVAAIGMYAAYIAGFSSLLMAPTQILAEQHYATIDMLFRKLGIRVDLVTGNKKTISKEDQKPKIVIGTHALLNMLPQINNIGFVVIDEQHRFGVKQRADLVTKQEKGETPHLLTMTATPIPRTIAKTFFGNLDLSVIEKPPKGRIAIKTWLVPNGKRKNGYEWMKKQMKETKGQIFIICPLIDESETLTTVKAVTEEYKNLQKIFPEYSVGLLHGRMRPTEKTAVLSDFRDKKYDILLATPVVEVGIDIPNATIMVIEAADRFGLGQLHQLRGRVGRSDKQSYCLLFTENEEETTITRLKAMETLSSGPELAELDLKLRGAGDVFGIRQHGAPILRVATFTDLPLIEETKKVADILIQGYPELTNLPYLRDLVKNDTIEEPID